MKNLIGIGYHAIGTERSKYVISKNKFKDHIMIIKNFGKVMTKIENINFSELNIVLCSFDDGNKSDIWAAEELYKNGFCSTFFIIQELSEKCTDKYVNKNDIRIISDMGNEIGVHGKTHEAWTNMNFGKLITDLKNEKDWIEQITGRECKSCSAPGGKINKYITKEIKDKNIFKYIRNCNPTVNCEKSSNEINTILIKKEYSDEMFRNIIIQNKNTYNYLQFEYKTKKIIKNILHI